MYEVKHVIDRIKSLQYYEVVLPIPDSFELSGRVPFKFSVTGDSVICTVLAKDYVEANTKVLNFFNSAV